MSGKRRFQVTAQARVLLGDRTVGILDYRNGDCWFTYQDLAADHPVLGQLFEDDPAHARRRSPVLPVWFANLLPERRSGLRRLINSELGVAESHDFHLLLHLGEDLPGAVVVRPEGALPSDMPSAETAPDDGTELGFSLSGMQLKFSMIRAGDGFALAGADEDGNWIVKLPSQVHPEMPANEYAMMRWAGLVGIDVPEHTMVAGSQLHGLPDSVASPDLRAFAISRFDRTTTGRIHQEDFAQVLDVRPEDKGRSGATQELLAQIVAQTCPIEDVDELIRRITFCIGVGNTDEHLKNWSLRYPDGRHPRLSPAYDLVSATAYADFRSSKLTLTVGGQRDIRYIGPDHFRRLAEAAGLDEQRVVDVVGKTVDGLRSSWQQIADDPVTPEFLKHHVTERLETVPLLRMP